MDSVPEMKIEVGELRSAVTDYSDKWQILLRIVADLSIYINKKLFFKESDFPVVEFAVAAQTWMASRSGDFIYNSMESEHEPLIEFRKVGDGAFLSHSPLQERGGDFTLDEQSLIAGLGSFISYLDRQLSSQFGVGIRSQSWGGQEQWQDKADL